MRIYYRCQAVKAIVQGMEKIMEVKVSTSQAFRDELAKAIVYEAHPAGNPNGFYYADPVDGEVYLKESNAAWSPWPDSVEWRIVGIEELIENYGAYDFSPCVDWDVADIDYSAMAIDYLEHERTNAHDPSEAEVCQLEEDGSIPEWVERDDVIAWASEDDRYKEVIAQHEETARDEAVSLAKGAIADSIQIKVLAAEIA